MLQNQVFLARNNLQEIQSKETKLIMIIFRKNNS